MPLVCYVSERDINTPLDAERLLRLLVCRESCLVFR